MAEHKRHQGHRQRMRERVQNYGLDSLAEHEALEYVLYLTNAQKDTNGIAHDPVSYTHLNIIKILKEKEFHV